MTGFLLELVLELLAEGCFALIRRHVRNKFFRGVLYVLTVLVIICAAMSVVLFVFAAGAVLLEYVLDILAEFLNKVS